MYGNSLIKKLKGKNVKYIIGSKQRISMVLSKSAFNYIKNNYKPSKEFEYLWIKS